MSVPSPTGLNTAPPGAVADASAAGGMAGGWRAARTWWAGLAGRERRLLTLAAAVLGAFLLWALALAPALRTLATAPALIAAGEAQARQMQALAQEATQLRAVAPVPMAQAQAALSAASARLGEGSKLSLQGERAVLAVKGSSGDQLAAFLAEARAGARARVVEASLSQTEPGRYDGSLTLALGAGP